MQPSWRVYLLRMLDSETKLFRELWPASFFNCPSSSTFLPGPFAFLHVSSPPYGCLLQKASHFGPFEQPMLVQLTAPSCDALLNVSMQIILNNGLLGICLKQHFLVQPRITCSITWDTVQVRSSYLAFLQGGDYRFPRAGSASVLSTQRSILWELTMLGNYSLELQSASH